MKKAHILYSGRVQGVGFRYTFQRMAVEFGLKGWIKNLPDGRVEAVIEGSQDDINNISLSIKEHFDSNIKDISIDYLEPEGAFKSFEIAY